MYCNSLITSTGTSRLVDHLVNCRLAPSIVTKIFKELREASASKRKAKEEHNELLAEEAEQRMILAKQQKLELKQLGIRTSLKTAEAEVADRAIANFFYANGIAFNIADPRVDSYFKAMCRAIKAAPEGYVPPNLNALAGPLLDSCYSSMQHAIQSRDKDGSIAKTFGITYSQDGWDSVDHLPLINSAYMTANDGGVFLRSVDTSGFTKSAEYIASLMICDIYSIGCTNVVLVVTDTCSTMKKAWTYVRDEFPWISAIPCVPHVASLIVVHERHRQHSRGWGEEGLVVSW